MAGRASISDKPDLLWGHAELETFYSKLKDNLKFAERYDILDKKLKLVSKTASTGMESLNARHGLRLEWSIVILTVIEIVLLIYDLFLR